MESEGCRFKAHQCRIKTFFGQTIFLKLNIGYLVIPQKKPCSWGTENIWCSLYLGKDISLEKIFVFKYSETVFHVVFIWNMQEKMLQELFWLHFLRHPICLNSSKIHLGVHYPLNALLVLVFQPHYEALSGFKESKQWLTSD